MVFRNLKVVYKIGFTLFLIIAGMLIIGLVNLRDASRINKRVNNLYTQEIKPLTILNSAKGAMYRYRDRTLRFLLETEGDRDRHIEHLTNQKQRLTNAISDYKETRLSEEEEMFLREFERIWNEYISEVENKVIPLAKEGRIEQAKDVFFSSSLAKFRRARDALNNLIQYQEKRAHRRYINANKIYESSRNISILLLGLTMGLSTLLGFNLIKSIKKPVSEVQDAITKLSNKDLTVKTDYESKDELGQTLTMLGSALSELNSAINEAKQVSNENSSIANELSATATQVSNNVENMATSVQVIREEGENVLNVINSTLTEAMQAKDIIKNASMELSNSKDKILQLSNAVKEAAQSEILLAEKIKGLREHSKEIHSIVKLIADIAEQTNLLALNAAIEAARAGEHGRGFSIVADEIRKLSQKIQSSLSSVSEIIDLMTSSVEDVSKQMQQNSSLIMQLSKTAMDISATIDDIVSKVGSASNSYESVMEGFLNNKKAVEQIINQIKEIDNLAASNARSVEEIASATEQLRLITEELRKKLDGFKTL